ncbi:MAG TPA: NAD(P)-dependent alcohol dehydrogenase [Candidatus Dormibacteraeota bacterium]
MAAILNPQRAETGFMRAIVCRKPTKIDALTPQEIDKPSISERDILIRVHASSVNPLDFFTVSRAAYIARWLGGRGRPKAEVVGMDFAGSVEAVGPAVTRFKVGDAVFGGQKGAFADYVAMAETGSVAHKPADVSFEQAAALPVAGVTALQAVRDHARFQAGEHVLINGASGGVGSFAIQLAKLFGAKVTAVCSSHNVEQARRLGADDVVDYSQEDFTRRPDRYDVVIDIAGSRSWSEVSRVMKPNARYVLAGGSAHTVYGTGRTIRHIFGKRLASLFAKQKFAFFIAKLQADDLTFLADNLATGKLIVAIDRQYDLSQISAAMAYLGDGHARGKIVVRVA